MFNPYLTTASSVFYRTQDAHLLNHVERVCRSVNSADQLPALRRYCALAKRKLQLPMLSERYIDAAFSNARDRVMLPPVPVRQKLILVGDCV